MDNNHRVARFVPVILSMAAITIAVLVTLFVPMMI